MSVSTATLQLVLEAENLADAALGDLTTGLDKVATKASSVAGKISGAFGRLGGAMSQALGQSVEQLAQGGDLGTVLAGTGAMMAGEVAQEFLPELIQKIAGSSVVAALAAPLGALGTAAGGLISAAIPIGMALLPVLLVAAIVAAITVLIVNEQIRNQVVGFATGLVGTLLGALSSALGALVDVIGRGFALAWDFVIKGVLPFILQLVALWLSLPGRIAGLGAELVTTIVNGLSSLPGRVADLVASAFRSLKIDVGPFHISGGGITVDLPKIDLPHFAGGVAGFGGGYAVVGERGPEVVRLPRGSDVIPNGGTAAPSSAGGFRVVGISERELLDIVDRGLFVKLQRSAATLG
jgi:hypothetical protein